MLTIYQFSFYKNFIWHYLSSYCF